MKLKDYLWRYHADGAIRVCDARSDEEQNFYKWRQPDVLFRDKTLIPKEVLNLEVRVFYGDLYFPGDFCSEEDAGYYDPYEDMYGGVMFALEGFDEVYNKLKLKKVVK